MERKSETYLIWRHQRAAKTHTNNHKNNKIPRAQGTVEQWASISQAAFPFRTPARCWIGLKSWETRPNLMHQRLRRQKNFGHLTRMEIQTLKSKAAGTWAAKTSERTGHWIISRILSSLAPWGICLIPVLCGEWASEAKKQGHWQAKQSLWQSGSAEDKIIGVRAPRRTKDTGKHWLSNYIQYCEQKRLTQSFKMPANIESTPSRIG